MSRERIQDESYLRREEADAAIRTLTEAGVPLRRIGQRLGHSRKVVRAVLRSERTNVFRVRQSSLDAYLPWLDAQWDGRGKIDLLQARLRPSAVSEAWSGIA
ncbi:hypothetical protein OICFNHDK_4396 [Methylobacterium bullatum]|uniref:Transposase IS30-like HTH domain-containing protein n=1 Tax=Methylobacterium bullatum TaxID=570505 RepID=A0AAV4ZEB1_9HYPH|nr:hypothetical protein OICFNHDK_4396 [Methylobacterium bullatum]